MGLVGRYTSEIRINWVSLLTAKEGRGFFEVKGEFTREGIRGRRLEMAGWEVNYQRLKCGAASARFMPGQGAERMTTDVLAPETKSRHVLRGINAFC